MTRRERLEWRLERRRAWAEGRRVRAEAAFGRADEIAQSIPFGQPVLVGHHSEKRHRRDLARMDAGMHAGCESMAKAKEHDSKADEIERALDRSVFSDDEDAVEALHERIEEREAQAERYAAINKAWRKSRGDLASLVAAGLVSEALAKTIADTMRLCPWLNTPLDTTGLRASIRRDKERIEEIERRRGRTAAAEQGGGVVVGRAGEAAGGNPVTPALDAARAVWYMCGTPGERT